MVAIVSTPSQPVNDSLVNNDEGSLSDVAASPTCPATNPNRISGGCEINQTAAGGWVISSSSPLKLLTGYFLNTDINAGPLFQGKIVKSTDLVGAQDVGFSPFPNAVADWGSIGTDDGITIYFMNNNPDTPFFLGNIVRLNSDGTLVDVGTTKTIFGAPEDYLRIAFDGQHLYLLNTNTDAGPAFRGKIVKTDLALNPVGDIFVENPDTLFATEGISGLTGFGTDGKYFYFLNSQGGGQIVRTDLNGKNAVALGDTSTLFGSPEVWTGFAATAPGSASVGGWACQAVCAKSTGCLPGEPPVLEDAVTISASAICAQ